MPIRLPKNCLGTAWINAILVGETLMRASNVPEKMRELLLKE